MATTGLKSSYLDAPSAAAYIGTTERFIRRLVNERRIRFYRVGRHIRFDTIDLDAFMAAGRVEPIVGNA